eukprot:c17646_g2_i1.p1 GENE.c17646_g2_i1~~c17646_g2_i1.p1  ORF type:complete len:424 (-),score=91.71 c17646_g2_i1:62-1177(-)
MASGGESASVDSTSIVFEHDVFLDGRLQAPPNAPLSFQTVGVNDLADYSGDKSNIFVSPGRGGALVIQSASPTLSAATLAEEGSEGPLTLSSGGGDSSLVFDVAGAGALVIDPPAPHSPAVLQGKSLLITGTSQASTSSSLSARDLTFASTKGHTADFKFTILSDSDKPAVLSGLPSAPRLRAFGIGPSSNLHIEPGTSGRVVVGASSGGSTEDVSAVQGAKGLALVGQTVRFESGSGRVVVGGDQAIEGKGRFTMRSITKHSGDNTNAPVKLGSLSSQGDFVVEVNTSVVDGVEYGITSSTKRALSLAGDDILLQPHGLGAVVIDNILQLPVLRTQTDCQQGEDDGRMWMFEDSIFFCLEGQAKRFSVDS